MTSSVIEQPDPNENVTHGLSISDKRRGFFIIYNDVLDAYGGAVGSSGIAVYAALCRFANRDSGETFVGQERIASVTGLSERTVRDTIKRLADNGLIQISKSRKHNSNLYSLIDIPANTAGSNRQPLPPNNTQGTSEYEPDGSGDKPPLLISSSRPNPVYEEYERLRGNRAGLRDTAVSLVRFAQTQTDMPTPRAIAAALGVVYGLCFGARVPPNYPRLMRLSQRLGGPERLVTVMLDVAAREVLGNPHDVIEKWRPAWQRNDNEKSDEVARTWGN